MRLEDIKNIGLLGGGAIGSGIAQALVVAGYKVIVRDLSDEILNKMKDTIINGRFGLKGGVERGKMTQKEMDEALARLSTTTRVEDLKNCDLIIEAIGGASPDQLENKALKLKVFAELDRTIKKEAIFATNTSFFTVADLARVTKRRDRFIGMHWFGPASIMKLVEIVYTADVSEDLIKQFEEFGKKLGKTTIRVKDVPGDMGHVANRIFFRGARPEAERIVREGIATAEDINTAMMLGFNWPRGPLPAEGTQARNPVTE